MNAVVRVAEVEEVETRRGTIRFVLRDESGNEYTTFRERIGAQAKRLEGRRARIEFHEEERGSFRNVYLDAIAPAPDDAPEAGDAGAEAGTDPDEVAWGTAVEAAPWLLGSREPSRRVPPEKLFERLKPFKDRVADDIREGGDDDEQEE